MKKIAVFGAGGFGREVACLINIINQKQKTWEFIGFFDDGITKGTKNEYGEVLGGVDELNKYSQELSVVIAISVPKTVSTIVEKITNKKVCFPNIISPDIVYLDEQSLSIGKGNIFCTGCLVSCNVKIGNFNIFNGYIPIGHDTIIGNFNSFMPSVKISGEVEIGERNFFGVNSVVLQRVQIGKDTTIGGSSLILRKTKDGMTYVGIPAKIVKY